ncbi:MAG: MinD/ParA family protein [Spirochaetaceae bacterium]
MSRERAKIVAIGSGKGGVGKSTTAINLTLILAKKGLRVALADLDPLSNLRTILDLPEIEVTGDDSPRRIAAFPRVDLLYPAPTLKGEETRRQRSDFALELSDGMAGRYDVILLDLPAGINAEENLSYLPLVSHLLVVVQPEPTSLVSAGGYIRAAWEIDPNLRIHLWYNKFAFESAAETLTSGVVETYNRYAPEELQLPEKVGDAISALAYIPPDLALDLLETSFTLEGHALYKTQGILSFLFDRLTPLPRGLDTPEARLIKARMQRVYVVRDVGETARRLVAEGPEGVSLEGYVETLKAFSVRRRTGAALEFISQRLEEIHGAPGGYDAPTASRRQRQAVDLILRLLKEVAASPALLRNSDVRNSGGVLLFYLAVLKLLSHRTVSAAVEGFLPVREDGRRSVRDRRRQIAFLVERDDEYHRRFYSLVQRLFPLLMRQTARLSDSFGLGPLLLRDASGAVNRSAYLKLLTRYLHDTLNSGLGVLVGLTMTPAAVAFSKGVESLLDEMYPKR